jgi:hypothetical protein
MPAEWYFAEDGQQCGPVPFEELQDRAKSGQIKPSDLVWKAGMPDWAPASSQPGLFGAPPPAARVAPIRNDELDDRAVDIDYRASRKPRSQGMGTGAIIVLVACGAGVVLMALCCGVVALIPRFNRDSNERSWNLQVGGSQHWAMPFQKGDKVRIVVTSNGNSDVDLFVCKNKANYDALIHSRNLDEMAGGLCVAFDNGPSNNCQVDFTAPQTGDYYVLVANRNSLNEPQRNGHNSGKLVFYPAPR